MTCPTPACRRIGWACLATLLAGLWLTPWHAAHAEDAPSAPAQAGQAPLPAGPDTTLWVEEDGATRPVLVGVTYDEFAKVWQAYQQRDRGPAEPLYTLEQLRADGEQLNGHAVLHVKLKVTLHTTRLVEVPLGFGKAILSELPDGLQADDLFGYSAQRETHLAYLKGGGQREIALKLLAPINVTGQRSELSVTAPRATLSQMQLQLTGRATEATVTDGVLLSVNDHEPGSQLVLQGIVGQVRLGWRTPTQTPVSFEPVLTASGELLTQLDGGSAQSRARLVVQSYGGEFERFRVRLPAGAQLVPNPADDASPVSVRSDPDGDSRVCLVTLPEKMTGPVSVDIYTEQAIGLADRRDPATSGGRLAVDLGGFEVLGAVRQEGYMAVVVNPDSRLRWGQIQGARRIAVEELPESLLETGVTHALRYFGQAFHASAELIRQDSRVEASTSYTLQILPEEALLDVATQYQISGPPVLDFAFELGDWTDTTADQIEPAALIDLQRVYQSDDGMLEAPLLSPQSKSLLLRFRARKTLPVDGEVFSFALPEPARPKIDLVGRTELTVLVDPSLELDVLPETQLSLQPEPLPPEKVLPQDPQGVYTRYYRSDFSLLSGEPLRLTGRLIRRPAVRRASVTSRVVVSDAETEVQQQVRFELLNRAASSLVLLAPPQLRSLDRLQVQLLAEDSSDAALAAGPPLPWVASEDGRSIEVTLPRPWLGPLTLSVTLPNQPGWGARGGAESLQIGLLTPKGCDSVRHELLLQTPSVAALDLATNTGEWRQEDGPPGVARFTTAGPADALTVSPAAVATQANDGLQVTRAWRQSWVREGMVQQRAAWRVKTSRDRAVVNLPQGVEVDQLEVRVDERLVRPEVGPAGQLQVPLAPDIGPPETTIELRYLQTLSASGFSSLRLLSPRLSGDDSLAVSYWHLIVPRSRLILGRPPGYEAAWDIAWLRGRFRRRQAMDCQQLESWVGAAPLGLTPSDQERVYLYSSIYTAPSTWAPRSLDSNLTTLAASAALLLVGLAVAYSPGHWRTIGIGTAAVAISLAAVLYPGELALAVQAGAIGMAALLVGWLTMVMLRPPQPLQVELSGDSTAIRLSTSSVETATELGTQRVSTNASTASLPTGEPQ